MGSFTVKHVQKQGATIVALAEWDKVGTYALYNEGLDYEDLAAFRAEHKSIVNYPKAERITLDDFGVWMIY